VHGARYGRRTPLLNCQYENQVKGNLSKVVYRAGSNPKTINYPEEGEGVHHFHHQRERPIKGGGGVPNSTTDNSAGGEGEACVFGRFPSRKLASKRTNSSQRKADGDTFSGGEVYGMHTLIFKQQSKREGKKYPLVDPFIGFTLM